jgi:host factor-I protein
MPYCAWYDNSGVLKDWAAVLHRPGRKKLRRQQRQSMPRQKRPKMASEKQQNLQDSFLNHVRKQKVPVTIFLVNGVKLQGVITWFDNFCLLLRRDAQSQLVYKHAISTIMPGAPIQLFDPEQNTDHD